MKRAGRIDTLLDLLVKEPNDIFLNYALGLEYASDPATLNEAEFQYKKVLQLDENYIAAYYQLGKLFESRNKNTEAVDYFKKGLEKAKLAKNNKAINEFGEAIFLLEE